MCSTLQDNKWQGVFYRMVRICAQYALMPHSYQTTIWQKRSIIFEHKYEKISQTFYANDKKNYNNSKFIEWRINMLCQFSIRNYKSIRDEMTFDMQAAAISEHEDRIIRDSDGEAFPPPIWPINNRYWKKCLSV